MRLLPHLTIKKKSNICNAYHLQWQRSHMMPHFLPYLWHCTWQALFQCRTVSCCWGSLTKQRPPPCYQSMSGHPRSRFGNWGQRMLWLLCPVGKQCLELTSHCLGKKGLWNMEFQCYIIHKNMVTINKIINENKQDIVQKSAEEYILNGDTIYWQYVLPINLQ